MSARARRSRRPAVRAGAWLAALLVLMASSALVVRDPLTLRLDLTAARAEAGPHRHHGHEPAPAESRHEPSHCPLCLAPALAEGAPPLAAVVASVIATVALEPVLAAAAPTLESVLTGRPRAPPFS